MRFIVIVFLNALSLVIGYVLLNSSNSLTGSVHITNIPTAILAGFVLSLINATIRPILQLLSLPLTILTLGLFLLVINTFMILLVDWIVPGFRVDSFLAGFLLALIVAILNLIYSKLNLR